MGIRLKNDQKIGRNDLCSCGSGLKFKWCHGDEVKKMLCNQVVNEYMARLIFQEQKKHGLVEWAYTCNVCGYSFDERKMSQIISAWVCPECGSPDLKKNGGQNEEKDREEKKD